MSMLTQKDGERPPPCMSASAAVLKPTEVTLGSLLTIYVPHSVEPLQIPHHS